MDNLSIITPVYGKSSMTSQFINSLIPYLDNNELILIDNGSPDNTLQAIAVSKKSFPNKDIKVFSHNRNAGFGVANNIGARLAKNELLLFLSNDVSILGDCFSPVVEFLQTDQNAICGPNLIGHNSGWNTFNDNQGRVITIPYVEGFCFGIRKTLFNMVGGFDENLFLDMEDLDLNYRLHLAGVGLAQINLPVMHSLGGSFDQLPQHRSEITAQSLNYFMGKWSFSR